MSVNSKKTSRSKPTEEASVPTSRREDSSTSPFTLSSSESSTPLDQARIARARQLLDQDGYPSEKILDSIAKHLARNWSEDGTPVVLSPPRP